MVRCGCRRSVGSTIVAVATEPSAADSSAAAAVIGADVPPLALAATAARYVVLITANLLFNVR